MNILMAEKGKQCEIYRNICDVYEEAYFSENVHKLAKNMFARTSLRRKSKSMVSIHTDSPVKKTSGNSIH